jgi:protein-S-isoprenylcysteine O-methyltransferase Ste14
MVLLLISAGSLDRWTDRATDRLLGLSALSWGVLRWTHSDPADRYCAVQIVVVAMQLCAGVLLIIRSPTARQGSLVSVAACLPSLILSGIALSLAPTPHQWPTWTVTLFVAGGVAAVISLCRLGRSFAFFPSIRRLVSGGPYRLIRHPAYAGELLMLLACGASTLRIAHAWPVLAAIPVLAMRIISEEKVLLTSPAYRDYAKRVRWRLVPGVW